MEKLKQRLIDSAEAYGVLSAYYHHRTPVQHQGLCEALNRVPEAVVRCGDCVRAYRDEWGFGRHEGCPFFDLYLYGQEPLEENGYCSYGERKSNETDLCRDGTRDARSV